MHHYLAGTWSTPRCLRFHERLNWSLALVTATDARRLLYRLLDEVAVTSEPIQITGRRKSAVLLSEDDWRSIEETLHLLSIPGMRESIREGMGTPLGECVEELGW